MKSNKSKWRREFIPSRLEKCGLGIITKLRMRLYSACKSSSGSRGRSRFLWQLLGKHLGGSTSAALDISTGPAHFSDRRASSGKYILSFIGPYGPPTYMSGHQISNSAGPNDDKSQYVFFACAPVPHLGSFRAVLLLQRDASVSLVGVGHVNQTH